MLSSRPRSNRSDNRLPPSSKPKPLTISDTVSETTYQSYNNNVDRIFFTEETFHEQMSALIQLAEDEKKAGNTLSAQVWYQIPKQALMALREHLISKFEVYKFAAFPMELKSTISAIKGREATTKKIKDKQDGSESISKNATTRYNEAKKLKDVHFFLARSTNAESDRIWKLFEAKIEAELKEKKENLKCPFSIKELESFKEIENLLDRIPFQVTKKDESEQKKASEEYHGGLKATNKKEAASKFRAAATLGHKDAVYQLAHLLNEPDHCEEARYLYGLDAMQGNPSACLQMIRCCRDQDKREPVNEGKEEKRSRVNNQHLWLNLFQNTFNPSQALEWNSQKAYDGFLCARDLPELQEETEFLCKMAIKGNDPISAAAARALISFWDSNAGRLEENIYEARTLFDKANPADTRKSEKTPEEMQLINLEADIAIRTTERARRSNILLQVNHEHFKSLKGDKEAPAIYYNTFYRAISSFYEAIVIQSTRTQEVSYRYSRDKEELGLKFLNYCLSHIPFGGPALASGASAGFETRQQNFRRDIQDYFEEGAKRQFGNATFASLDCFFQMIAQKMALVRFDAVSINKPTGLKAKLAAFQGEDIRTDAHYKGLKDALTMVEQLWEFRGLKNRQEIRPIVAGGPEWLAAVILQFAAGVEESKEPKPRKYSLIEIDEARANKYLATHKIPDYHPSSINRYEALKAKEMRKEEQESVISELEEKNKQLTLENQKRDEEIAQLKTAMVRSEIDDKKRDDKITQLKTAQEKLAQLEEMLLLVFSSNKRASQTPTSLTSSPLLVAPPVEVASQSQTSTLTSSSSSSMFATASETSAVTVRRNSAEGNKTSPLPSPPH